MEVWLKSYSKRFRLPVIPSEYTVTGERGDEVVNINSIGEVDLAGNRKLKQVSWSCFFPCEYDESYCQYSGLKSPKKSVELIEKMMHIGPVKLIITGTPVKFWTRISSFEWGEHDGSGDIYYSITLKEHRPITVSSSTVASDDSLSSGTSADTTTQRTVPETEEATITVTEEGMSASAVARKYTGSASNKSTFKQTGKKQGGTLKKKDTIELPKGTTLQARGVRKGKVQAVDGTTVSTHTYRGTHTKFAGATGRKF